MATPPTTTRTTRVRLPSSGLAGFVAVTVITLLVVVAANVRAAPAARQNDGTTPTCDVASPAASPGSTPAADSSDGSSRIDRVVSAGRVVQNAGASPEASPATGDCVEPPSGDDLLATAAALLEAATATAAAEAAAGADAPTEAAPAPTVAAPTPTESPGTGEVTETLPAADIPSTNVQGLSFNLAASLDADLAAVVTQAPVYRLSPPSYDAATVTALATTLGITGAVEDRGNGTFSASGNGELFVTPNLIQFLSPAIPGEGDLPDDATSIELAREWLRTSTLVQPDLGEGSVVSRDDATGRLVVVFTPLEPVGLLAAYPSISVSLGRGGVVLEVSSRWAVIQRSDLYQLRPAEEAWRQVESGQGYIETDLTGSGIPEGSVVSGLVTYDVIGLVYTTAGPPGTGQYLVPIFVFTGQLTPEGTTQPYPIRAYVPALASSDTPVGFTGSPL